MGLSCWELYLLEHGISKDGFREDKEVLDNDTFTTFFDEIDKSKKFVPRAVMVDLEPSVIGKRGLCWPNFVQFGMKIPLLQGPNKIQIWATDFVCS